MIRVYTGKVQEAKLLPTLNYEDAISFLTKLRFDQSLKCDFWIARLCLYDWLEIGKTKSGESNRFGNEGAFVFHFFSKDSEGFHSTRNLSTPVLQNTIRNAISNKRIVPGLRFQKQLVNPVDEEKVFPSNGEISPQSLNTEEKEDLVRNLFSQIERYDDPKITYVNNTVETHIVTSAGGMITKKEYSIFLLIAFKRQGVQYFNSMGGDGLEHIKVVDEISEESMTLKRIKRPENKLVSSTGFTFILSPQVSQLLCHEAIGHLCEADFSKISLSQFPENKSNEPHIKFDTKLSVVDDPQWADSPYRYLCDDEGVVPSKVELIKHGTLNDYLNNIKWSSLLNRKTNGHGRCGYNIGMMTAPHVGVTRIVPSDYSTAEMFDIKQGIYLSEPLPTSNLVDTSSGFFEISANALSVRNGEVTGYLGPATVSGNAFTALKKVDAIGKEEKSSLLVCFKNRQATPVVIAAPYLRLNYGLKISFDQPASKLSAL